MKRLRFILRYKNNKGKFYSLYDVYQAKFL
jgi:hypothetical protein